MAKTRVTDFLHDQSFFHEDHYAETRLPSIEVRTTKMTEARWENNFLFASCHKAWMDAAHRDREGTYKWWH